MTDQHPTTAERMREIADTYVDNEAVADELRVMAGAHAFMVTMVKRLMASIDDSNWPEES